MNLMTQNFFSLRPHHLSCTGLSLRLIAACILLLFTTSQLPAPIHEEADPQPKATASPTPKTKPSQDHSAKSSASPKSKPKENVVTVEKQSRFAGSWVGTMPTFPWGNVEVILTVDPTGTTMKKSWSGNPNYIAKTQLKGDTLWATCPALEGSWSITPQPDGTTALVRLLALMNDQSVVFHRAADKPADVKPSK